MSSSEVAIVITWRILANHDHLTQADLYSPVAPPFRMSKYDYFTQYGNNAGRYRETGVYVSLNMRGREIFSLLGSPSELLISSVQMSFFLQSYFSLIHGKWKFEGENQYAKFYYAYFCIYWPPFFAKMHISSHSRVNWIFHSYVAKNKCSSKKRRIERG